MKPTLKLTPIVVLLIVIGAYRLSLLDRGAMSFSDETHYTNAVSAVVSLRGGHVRQAVLDIVTCTSRPGDAITRLVPALLQVVPYALGIPPTNPRALLIPTVCNVIVSLITLYMFFKVARVLFDGDETLAFTAAAVYSLAVNTNLYVRHLLPCDWCLCVLVIALWLIVSRPLTSTVALCVGLLCGAAVTIYPGYYLLSATLGLVLVVHPTWRTTGARARAAAMFFAGGMSVALVLEAAARSVGTTYIQALLEFSRSVEQGSLGDGWSFLPEYFVTVEGLTGVMFMAGFVVFLARAVWDMAHGRSRTIQWVILPTVLAFAWQAFASAQLDWLAIYGRILHEWYIFFALAVADSIGWLPRPRLRAAACAAAVIIAIVSLAPTAWAYYHLAYPLDVVYNLGVDSATLTKEHMACEMNSQVSYTSPPPFNRVTRSPYSAASDFFLVNFCFGLSRGTDADQPVQNTTLPTVSLPAGRAAATAAGFGYAKPHGTTAVVGETPGGQALVTDKNGNLWVRTGTAYAPYVASGLVVQPLAAAMVPDNRAVIVPSGATLLYERPHFLTFPAYGFEGLAADHREGMRLRKYTFRVYKLPPTTTSSIGR